MTGSHSPGLVALSLVLALLASSTALALAGRVGASRGLMRQTWLAGGAIAMGVGIWSMHFIGMLAFRLHAGGARVPMTYDLPHLLGSVGVAVAASGVALAFAGRRRDSPAALVAATVALGAAIAGMHYLGMAGLHAHGARVAWDWPLVAASVGIALAASAGALWLVRRLWDHAPFGARRLGAAAVMGGAIAGMHYTGMAAARFVPVDAASAYRVPEWALLATPGLGVGVALATLVVLGVALLGALLDRRFHEAEETAQRETVLRREAEEARTQAEALASRLEAHTGEMEAQVDETRALARDLAQANAGLHVANDDLAAAERRLALLAEAGVILAGSLDYETTLAEIARLAVPDLADYCLVDVIDADGRYRRVAEAHRDPSAVARLKASERYYEGQLPPDHPFRAAYDAGVSRLEVEVSEQWLRSVATSPEHLALMRQNGPRSIMHVPLRGRGRSHGLLTLVATDASGRRYAPADLNLAEDLARRAALAIDNAVLFREIEAANQAKAGFLTTMSHELRTPLNAIAGYVDLMELGIRGPVTAAQLEDFARIKRAQRHLLALIEGILNFAKIEAGRIDLRLEPVALADVMRGIEPLVAPLIAGQRLTYECRDDGVPTPLVRADADRLEQVVLNLLSNAIKFTPAGGRITVELCGRDDVGVLRVRDTGVGIPPDKLVRIFDPFVQLDQSLTRKHDGTGLGLAISRDLTRAMGGDLTAESPADGGALFTLTLPRADVPSVHVPAAAAH